MGFIKWLTKDTTSRRRESAPAQTLLSFDPNKTRDESYREKMAKFAEYRSNERSQRFSLGPNDMSAAYQSIIGENDNHLAERERNHLPQRSTSVKSKRNQNIEKGDEIDHASSNANVNEHARTKKISVQFHLNNGSDDTEMSYKQQPPPPPPRHSMPASSHHSMYKQKSRKTKQSNGYDAYTIQEEESMNGFRAACNDESIEDGIYSNPISPPWKCKKINSNPYPTSHGPTSTSSEISELTGSDSRPIPYPEKPKRLLLNSQQTRQQTRKFLTEAQTNGYFPNFEIQSPYYSDSSSMALSFVGYKNEMRNSRETLDSLNGESTSQLNRYQTITNKHGEDVEYALPCVDQHPQYQRHKFPPQFPIDEVFEEDPAKCEELLNQQLDSDTSESTETQEEIPVLPPKQGRRVMVTDLDKSSDSLIQESLNTSKSDQQQENANPATELHMRPVNPILEYFEKMHSADFICLISDFIPMRADEHIMQRIPLYTQFGTFKKCDATIRRYHDELSDPDLAYIAETAIIRDLDVLRKIRHENIVNLMAIGFEPYRRIALIMEPVKYTLNDFLFEKFRHLALEEVVRITVTIAQAVLYLQECNLCHSNISSHTILITAHSKNVKLAFFELAVPYRSDIQDEVELQMMQQQHIDRSICEIPAKYLPYYIPYRRTMSMFNYQAPELLSHFVKFVFPTRQSDTYAITLLLWELLNRRIPFEKYDEAELNELLKTNYPLKFLPIKEEERCQRFHEIIERGLKREPSTRIELERIISKLNAIELEIGRENDKQKSPSKVEPKPKEKPMYRQSHAENIRIDDGERATPDKSISKVSSIGLSPSENMVSPMNNAASSALQRSILDFNKLLSPRRIGHDDAVERSSTLKKRRKTTPTRHNKNGRDLFVNGKSDPSNRISDAVAKTNEICAAEQLANELNNAQTKSFISKQLDYSIDGEKEPSEESMDRIRTCFANKVSRHPFDNVNVSKSTGNSNSLVLDNYQLPQELIARNNKIRRYTWLSTDQMNSSSQCEPAALVVATRSDDIPPMPTLDESGDGHNQKLNVSIKIVRKQISPDSSFQHNSSMRSDCSTASAVSNEESFSVKSRIKFFRSLESQPVQRRTPVKNASDMSRRSEISFKEARKAVEKTYRHTYPTSNPPAGDSNQQLLKDISCIAAEIQESLKRNPYLSGRLVAPPEKELNNKNELEYLFNRKMKLNDDIEFNNKLNEDDSVIEESEKRNSVREAIQKFELSMRNDKNELNPLQKVENKLLNEKIINTEPTKSVAKIKEFLKQFEEHDAVTEEKVEDLIRVEVPSEIENESGTQLALCTSSKEQSAEVNNDDSDHKTQTLIKRTFYQESIVSGQNIEMNDLLMNSPNLTKTYSTTKKQSLTTHVTLNMRKCRRHASDVGLNPNHLQMIQNSVSGSEVKLSPRMADDRHSICGSPISQHNQVKTISATSGRKLEQIAKANLRRSASGVLVASKTQIQSIEDLYIDDDFDGSNLAANMKLFTNSMDLLDGIDFNLISTRIYEETMSTNNTGLAITDQPENFENDENIIEM